jgi:hypothetical protein
MDTCYLLLLTSGRILTSLDGRAAVSPETPRSKKNIPSSQTQRLNSPHTDGCPPVPENTLHEQTFHSRNHRPPQPNCTRRNTKRNSSDLTLSRLTATTGRTAPLTSRCSNSNIYSTDIGTEYFKHLA